MLPSHASREILILMGSLTTCDPGDITVTIQVYECGKCNRIFCLDCDLFIHDSLHTCPGCSTSPSALQAMAGESASR
ncbi:hypothetical protein C0J52_06399 [Blattella germanica]|nr:hypothetical protein C0J52_06399 [Blattella germanica]